MHNSCDCYVNRWKRQVTIRRMRMERMRSKFIRQLILVKLIILYRIINGDDASDCWSVITNNVCSIQRGWVATA